MNNHGILYNVQGQITEILKQNTKGPNDYAEWVGFNQNTLKHRLNARKVEVDQELERLPTREDEAALEELDEEVAELPDEEILEEEANEINEEPANEYSFVKRYKKAGQEAREFLNKELEQKDIVDTERTIAEVIGGAIHRKFYTADPEYQRLSKELTNAIIRKKQTRSDEYEKREKWNQEVIRLENEIKNLRIKLLNEEALKHDHMVGLKRSKEENMRKALQGGSYGSYIGPFIPNDRIIGVAGRLTEFPSKSKRVYNKEELQLLIQLFRQAEKKLMDTGNSKDYRKYLKLLLDYKDHYLENSEETKQLEKFEREHNIE